MQIRKRDIEMTSCFTDFVEPVSDLRLRKQQDGDKNVVPPHIKSVYILQITCNYVILGGLRNQ